jgi:hypothetical protein
MLVYVCDVLTGATRSLGFVEQPDQNTDVDVRVLSWDADGFDAAFRQYAARPPLFSAFHIDLTGTARALGTPTDTVQASQVLSPACQETVDSLNRSTLQRGASGFYSRP